MLRDGGERLAKTEQRSVRDEEISALRGGTGVSEPVSSNDAGSGLPSQRWKGHQREGSKEGTMSWEF